jgi:CheY-like chemotaxis protein
MRMLLVEDDPMIGESVQQGVRQDALAVDWVQDGEAAELALRTTAYTLVLLDLGLPHKNGLEVWTTLRRTGRALSVYGSLTRIRPPIKSCGAEQRSPSPAANLRCSRPYSDLLAPCCHGRSLESSSTAGTKRSPATPSRTGVFDRF